MKAWVIGLVELLLVAPRVRAQPATTADWFQIKTWTATLSATLKTERTEDRGGIQLVHAYDEEASGSFVPHC